MGTMAPPPPRLQLLTAGLLLVLRLNGAAASERHYIHVNKTFTARGYPSSFAVDYPAPVAEGGGRLPDLVVVLHGAHSTAGSTAAMFGLAEGSRHVDALRLAVAMPNSRFTTWTVWENYCPRALACSRCCSSRGTRWDGAS